MASAALLVPAALAVSACGGDSGGGSKPSKVKPTVLSITTSDAGKGQYSMQAPKSIKGGLVEIRFKNAGKAPHEAQLIRVEGDHSLQDVLNIVATEGPTKIPAWLYTEGGVAAVPPGKQLSTTENLPAGHYFVTDSGHDGPAPSASGAVAEIDVASGPDGELPATTATIVAKSVGKEKFRFEASGLKAGPNQLLFKNDSKADVPHHVVAFPILPGKSLADVKKALSEEGKPSGPPPVDFMNGTNTEVIDGKRELVTTVNLKAGRYALVCFLNDRDELEPHFKQGMLKEVDVK